MSILCLSGWGQPADALHAIAPDAVHLDYTVAGSVEAALELLAKHEADTVIGWSMGGQLAVRAISAGLLKTKKLVLIATPFQFVREQEETLGMGRDTFYLFRENLQASPARTFRKSYALITHDDGRADSIAPYLEEMHTRMPGRDWLYWLDALANYNCMELDFSRFPPTLLIHGLRDHVVAPAQSGAFFRRLPNARLEVLPECAHAPHWHDSAQVRAWIADAA